MGRFLIKIFFSKAAYLLLLLGVIGAVAAVLTGKQAELAFEYWNKEAGQLMEAHEMYANITLWYFTAILILRTVFVLKKKFTGYFRYIFVALAIVGAYFVYETGDHGGRMVYEHGIGTQYKINVMEDE